MKGTIMIADTVTALGIYVSVALALAVVGHVLWWH